MDNWRDDVEYLYLWDLLERVCTLLASAEMEEVLERQVTNTYGCYLITADKVATRFHLWLEEEKPIILTTVMEGANRLMYKAQYRVNQTKSTQDSSSIRENSAIADHAHYTMG